MLYSKPQWCPSSTALINYARTSRFAITILRSIFLQERPFEQMNVSVCYGACCAGQHRYGAAIRGTDITSWTERRNPLYGINYSIWPRLSDARLDQ